MHLAWLVFVLFAAAPGAGESVEEPEVATDGAVETVPAAPAPKNETVIQALPTLAKDRSGDGTTVEGDRLRESARASTFEALSQESAGLYVSGRGVLHGVANGSSGALHLRGLGGSPTTAVLVVEDGVPDYQGIFGHPIPDAYVPALVDQALVLKGGDSVLYGSNALGGAILLRSRWRGTDGWELASDSAAGSFATVRETASLLGRDGAWDVRAAVHALSTEGHRAGAGGDELVVPAAVRWRLTPDLDLSLRNKALHLRGADPGPVTHPTPDHTFDVWRDNVSLELAWRTPVASVTVTPYANVGVHRLYDGFHSLDYVAGGIAEAFFRLHPRLDLLVGHATNHVDGTVEDVVTREKTPVEGTTDTALYDQLTWRPLDGLSLVAGTRQLYSSRWGFLLLYKGGLRWRITDGLVFRARVSRSFRQPTLRELYLPYPTANPDLRPERALLVDAGLTWAHRYVEVECTAYRTDATDLIKTFGSWPAAEVVNIDRLVAWGVEGRLAFPEIGPASFRVTGDWQHVGRYTRQNPSAKVDAALEARHDWGVHRLSGGLTGEWVHGLYMDNYSRHPISDVFAMDLALRYRYSAWEKGWAVEPYLFVRNVLDRDISYIEGYPMPRLNVLVGLKVEL
jgi:iron complex outermembrane receptor protein